MSYTPYAHMRIRTIEMIRADRMVPLLAASTSPDAPTYEAKFRYNVNTIADALVPADQP